MKLPSADLAVIEPVKIRDYLLSTEHPVGRFKAAFFGGLGYTRDDWPRLRHDLLVLAASEQATPGQASAFGQKYEVRGTIQGPSGRNENRPRLVTAFPG